MKFNSRAKLTHRWATIYIIIIPRAWQKDAKPLKGAYVDVEVIKV